MGSTAIKASWGNVDLEHLEATKFVTDVVTCMHMMPQPYQAFVVFGIDEPSTRGGKSQWKGRTYFSDILHFESRVCLDAPVPQCRDQVGLSGLGPIRDRDAATQFHRKLASDESLVPGPPHLPASRNVSGNQETHSTLTTTQGNHGPGHIHPIPEPPTRDPAHGLGTNVAPVTHNRARGPRLPRAQCRGQQPPEAPLHHQILARSLQGAQSPWPLPARILSGPRRAARQRRVPRAHSLVLRSHAALAW